MCSSLLWKVFAPFSPTPCVYVHSLSDSYWWLPEDQNTMSPFEHLIPNMKYRLFNIRIAFITTPRPAANRLACGLGVVIKAILILNRGYVGMSRRTFSPTPNLPVFIILFTQTGLVISNQDFGLIRISCFNSLFWVESLEWIKNPAEVTCQLDQWPLRVESYLVIFIFSIHVRPKPLLLL